MSGIMSTVIEFEKHNTNFPELLFMSLSEDRLLVLLSTKD